MTELLWSYGLLCGFIALRLLAFRRAAKEQHRPRMTWLAYALVVATGSVPLRLLFGEHVPLDVSSFVVVLVLALALCASRGNVADLFREPKQGPEHSSTQFLRKTP